MKLEHYGSEPLVLDRARSYDQELGYKPHGFWVSVAGEDDWPSWCRSEGFALNRLGSAAQVTLKPDANVLVISNTVELLAFHEEFKVAKWSTIEFIDWPRVSETYDGIIVAPYQRTLRMEIHWYYGWDVASGCIWNLEAIA